MVQTDKRTTLLIFLFGLSIILAAVAGSIPGYMVGAKKAALQADSYVGSVMGVFGSEWANYGEMVQLATKDSYLAGVKDTAKFLEQDLGPKCDLACIQSAQKAPAVLSQKATGYGFDLAKVPDWSALQEKIKLSSEMSAQGSAKDMTATVKWDLRTDESFSPTHLLAALAIICATFLVVMFLLCRTAIAWKNKS